MSIQGLKKWALLLTFWVALHTSSLRAQIFTAPLQASTTGTNPVDFVFRADGTLISKGNFGIGSLSDSDQGSGTRMLWYPALGAFRAGTVPANGSNSTLGQGPWDLPNIGAYSVAFGLSSTASGYASAAFGQSGARGAFSAAFGSGAARGIRATAFGQGIASGDNSTAFANGNAIGGDSTASGYSKASGQYSTASGYYCFASGYGSTASGSYSTAAGALSTSSGSNTYAQAYLSFAIGTCNVNLSETGGTPSPTTWNPADPLFEIGNGTASTPSDALIIYKDGSAKFSGSVQVPQSGDIPMYTGN